MNKTKVALLAFLVSGLLFTSALVVSTADALQETKTLNPTADADVFSEFPESNRGRQHDLRVEEYSQVSLVFLMFDLGGVPSDASVEWAKLGLLTEDAVVYNALISVYYCSNNDWTEDGITYNNKPSYSETPLDTVNVTTMHTPYEWNVTGTVKSTLLAADKRLSLVLKADTPGSVEFYSRQNPFYPSYYPELSVEYDAPPQTGIYIPKELIIVAVIGAVVIGLEIIYLNRKRRKPQAPSQFSAI